MPIRYQLIALALGLVALWGYGHHQYRQGVADTKAEAVLAQISIEQGLQYERDREAALHRGAVLARDLALRDLSDIRSRLDRVYADARNAQASQAVSGSIGSGPDWIGGFGACYAEYADLARDAAGWADQVNGLQGYVRAINP